MWLVVTTKKMPDRQRIKPICIPITHPLLSSDAEICLITKDPQREFKDLVASAKLDKIKKVFYFNEGYWYKQIAFKVQTF